jgi:hypothetical protein
VTRELAYALAIFIMGSPWSLAQASDDVVATQCTVTGVAAFLNRIHIRCDPRMKFEDSSMALSLNAGSFAAVPLTPETELFASKVLSLLRGVRRLCRKADKRMAAAKLERMASLASTSAQMLKAQR